MPDPTLADVYTLIERLKSLGARNVTLNPPGIGPIEVTFGLPTHAERAQAAAGDPYERVLFAHEGME